MVDVDPRHTSVQASQAIEDETRRPRRVGLALWQLDLRPVAARDEPADLGQPDLATDRPQQRCGARGLEAVGVDVVVQSPVLRLEARRTAKRAHPPNHVGLVEQVGSEDLAARTVAADDRVVARDELGLVARADAAHVRLVPGRPRPDRRVAPAQPQELAQILRAGRRDVPAAGLPVGARERDQGIGSHQAGAGDPGVQIGPRSWMAQHVPGDRAARVAEPHVAQALVAEDLRLLVCDPDLRRELAGDGPELDRRARDRRHDEREAHEHDRTGEGAC